MAVCLCFIGKASAQWVVSDPGNLAQGIINTTKQIVQTSTTAKNTLDGFMEAQKIFQQGKKYYDALKAVHDVVKGGIKVKKSIELVAEISEIYVRNYQNMLADPNYTPDELTAISAGYAKLLSESADVLQDLKNVVNVTGMSLTDAERLAVINNAYKSLLNYRNLVNYYTRKNISVSYLRAKKKNDTDRVLAAINFTDIDNLSTFKACLAANEEPLYSSLLSKAEGTTRSAYLTECDILASALAKEIEISPRDTHYFKEKPAAGAYEISRTVEVIPERRTELIDIEIKVTNITSAAGAPRSHLTAMCEGVNMETASKYGNSVTHEFVLNNKRMEPDNHKVGTISKKLVSFGPEQENDACVNRHQLVMHFVLVNGETHTVTLDVRDLIKTSHDETQRVHKIRAEITLPEAIGNGDGVFDPDIEEWEEIETELPI